MAKIFLIVLFLASCLISNSQEFEVRPMKLHLGGKSGNVYEKKIMVKNYSQTKEQYSITYGDFIKGNDGHTVFYKSQSMPQSLIPFINIFPAFFELAPNDSIDVRVVLQIPDSIAQSLWGVVYVKNKHERDSSSADTLSIAHKSIKINPQIATKVYFHIDDSTKFKLNLSELQFNHKNILSITATNPSPNIFTGRATIIITDLKKNLAIFNQDFAIEIFPGFTRDIEYQLPDEFPVGQYSFEIIFSDVTNNYIFGKQLLFKTEN